MITLIRKTSVLVVSIVLATIAQAQGRLTSVSGLHPIVGCFSSVDVAATAPGSQWQTWPVGGMLPARTPSTAGRSDRGFLYIDAQAHVLYNMSARATITGRATSYGLIEMTSQTMISSPTDVRITILGPSLDAFGVHGARSFTWEARNAYTGELYVRGSGETTTPISVTAIGSTVVVVTPSSPTEYGDVVISYDY